jgi:hypothetical protein
VAWAGTPRTQAAQVEQVDFSAEAESVERPVSIPDDVLTVLAKDDFVRSAMEGADSRLQTLPSSWFSAARVHLDKSNAQDLVILGEGPLTGANVIRFWIFRDTGHGYELVLRAAGHDLHVKQHRSNGYRDIETASVTMMQFNSELFRFDGKRYVSQGVRTEPIK